MISLLELPSQAALLNISFPIPFSKKIKTRVAPSVTRLKPQQVKQLACMVSAGAYHAEPMPRWCLKSYKSLYQVPDKIFIPNSCFLSLVFFKYVQTYGILYLSEANVH